MTPPDVPGPAGAFLEVPQIAVELGERFRAAGHDLYLVGGAIRDIFLHRPVDELDFATSARPGQTIDVLQGWAETRYLQGVEFGTVGAMKQGQQFEITTFRQEVYPAEDRHPNVTFGDSVEVDLSRRDFTVNAMAVRLPEREFVDPYGGLRDLAAKRLDTPLDPEVAFGDDPLRMLRAARFMSTLDLPPAPRVKAAIERMAGRLEIVSAERIRDELSNLLVAPDPTGGLHLTVETGLADQFLPELPALRLEQDPVHRHKDVLRHTFVVVAKCQPDLVLRLAALLHDIGKPVTRQITADGVQFHHHEAVGARMARERLKALRYPNDVVESVVKLVELHLRFHTYQRWTDAGVRRYVRDAGPLLDPLNQLVRADCTTRNPFRAKALAALQDDLELRIARLAEEENLERMRPPLDGHQVMEYLGIGPGPVVGEALDYLMEQRLERGPIPEDKGYRLLEEWAKRSGIEPGPSGDRGGLG
jgi:poly(A) polymerase